jgi:hypothetical protein
VVWHGDQEPGRFSDPGDLFFNRIGIGVEAWDIQELVPLLVTRTFTWWLGVLVLVGPSLPIWRSGNLGDSGLFRKRGPSTAPSTNESDSKVDSPVGNRGHRNLVQLSTNSL